MIIPRLSIKYHLYNIPVRCSKCDQIKWGQFCTNRNCNIESEIKLIGITLRTLKN